MVLISRFSFEENCVNIWMILDGMYIRHLFRWELLYMEMCDMIDLWKFR